jgi:hypothetical protein
MKSWAFCLALGLVACASDSALEEDSFGDGDSAESSDAIVSAPTPRMAAVRDAIKSKFNIAYGIGCVRADSIPDHPSGIACDFMLASGTLPSATNAQTGDAVAAWAKANATTYGVQYVIWKQKIWNIARNAEGWRAMADRGGITANHFDHVHITVKSGAGPIGPVPAPGPKPPAPAPAPTPPTPAPAPKPKPAGDTVGVSAPCVPGGDYCGMDKVLGDPNTLYVCNDDGQSATLSQVCANGCAVNPGQNDACQ